MIRFSKSIHSPLGIPVIWVFKTVVVSNRKIWNVPSTVSFDIKAMPSGYWCHYRGANFDLRPATENK
jgi:hypothetical protein